MNRIRRVSVHSKAERDPLCLADGCHKPAQWARLSSSDPTLKRYLCTVHLIESRYAISAAGAIYSPLRPRTSARLRVVSMKARNVTKSDRRR